MASIVGEAFFDEVTKRVWFSPFDNRKGSEGLLFNAPSDIVEGVTGVVIAEPFNESYNFVGELDD